MPYIVTALHCEAIPFIEHWNLRREVHRKAFQVFRGDTAVGPIELIVTGIGKMRSAVGTTTLVSGAPSPTPLIVNIGVCAAPPTASLGSIHYVNKVIDNASGQTAFPDSIVAHGVPESTLTTFDAPLTASPQEHPEVTLADMEGSGFAEAASIYTAPSAWGIFKVVSDHYAPAGLTKDGITELITPHVGRIEDFIGALATAHSSEKFSFAPGDKAILDEFLGAYRLTASQRKVLTTAAREFVLRSSGTLAPLKRFMHREPSSKAELKQIFNEALRALAET